MRPFFHSIRSFSLKDVIDQLTNKKPSEIQNAVKEPQLPILKIQNETISSVHENQYEARQLPPVLEVENRNQVINPKVCFECGAPAGFDHHVIPRSKGGTKTLPLCPGCHAKIHGPNLLSTARLTKLGLKNKMARNEKTGGEVPFGYNVTSTGKLKENKKEQEIIKLIISLRSQGNSLRQIVNELISRGYKTKTGRNWHPSTLAGILKRHTLKETGTRRQP